MAYLIFKNGIHIATASSADEADEIYAKFEADDIQTYENDA